MTERELRDGLEKAVKRGLEQMHGLAIEASNDYFKRAEAMGERSFVSERARIIHDTVLELESFVRQEIKIFSVEQYVEEQP